MDNIYIIAFLLVVIIFLIYSNCSHEYFYSELPPANSVAIFGNTDSFGHRNYIYPIKSEINYNS